MGSRGLVGVLKSGGEDDVYVSHMYTKLVNEVC